MTPTMKITKDNVVKMREAEKENWDEGENLTDRIPKSETITIARIAPRVALKITIKEPIIIPKKETYFE